MSDLIYNDGTKRIRAPLRAPESSIAQELRLDSSLFLSPRVSYDGFVELPSLNDWREAERAARKRLEPKTASEDTHKNTDKQSS